MTVPDDGKLLKLVRNGDSNNVYMHVVTIANTLNQLRMLTSEDLTHEMTHAEEEHIQDSDDYHAVSDAHVSLVFFFGFAETKDKGL